MIQLLRNAFLYAGVDRLSFEAIRPKIRKANRTMTIVTSAFATILIALVFISSFKSEGIKQNKVVYGIGLIMSILVLVSSTTIARKHDKFIMPLVYAAYSIYYLYGIIIGAVTDPTGKAVTFMVMLVFMPTLFIDRPIHVILVTTLHIALFIVLCFINKTGTVLSVDVMDAVIFGILGTASGSVINHMKVQGYLSEQKLQEVSRLDQLTGLNNQNAFKIDLYSLHEHYKHTLACVYIDANGLHDLNNEKGHAEGDKMLQLIAKEILIYFGAELTYRVGGDEFVAFAPDPDRNELTQKIEDLIQAIEERSYSIAVGYEVSSARLFSVEELVKAADLRMQEDKRIFHKERGK